MTLADAGVPVTPGDDSVAIVIARDPALVRTVRLVAAAVARRAQVSDSVIEEIRLAVGEACALMIGLDDEADPPAPAARDEDRVSVGLSAIPGLAVTVTGRIAGTGAGLDGVDLDPFALIRGLCESLEVDSRDDGTTALLMRWG